MAAQDNLSSQLFHGTNVKLKKGDVVKPSGDPEKTNWALDSDHTKAYATEQIGAAAFFGSSAKGGGDIHIYHVEPLGKTEKKNIQPVRSRRKTDPIIEHSNIEGFKVIKKAKTIKKGTDEHHYASFPLAW
jgi:hypothetical protein